MTSGTKDQEANMLLMLGDLIHLLTKKRSPKKQKIVTYPIWEYKHKGNFRRFALPNAAGLASTGPLAVVGFFGIVKDEIDDLVRQQIDEGDIRMLKKLESAKGIMAYITYQIDAKDSMNTIIFSDQNSVHAWAVGRDHRNLAMDVAPNYYSHVTIVHGILPQGLFDLQELQISEVKFRNYDTQNPA